MPGYRLARVNTPVGTGHSLTLDDRHPLSRCVKLLRAISVWLNRGLAIQSAEERARHVAAVKRVVCDPELKDVHSWLHLNLIIIDSKAQSVLSLYSIALATLTIFYSSMGSKTRLRHCRGRIGTIGNRMVDYPAGEDLLCLLEHHSRVRRPRHDDV